MFQTDADGYIDYGPGWKVSGPDLYQAANGAYHFPFGTVIIKEKTAPAGYQKSSEVHIANITPDGIIIDGRTTSLDTWDARVAPEIKESRQRGDFSLTKKDNLGNGMSGVQFRLTMVNADNTKVSGSKYTAVITTGVNGIYNSANDSSLWIGEDTKVSGQGRLPVGRYVLEEISGTANSGYELADRVYFEIAAGGNTTKDLGTIYNYHTDITSTTLTAANGLHVEEAKTGVTLTDSIAYTGFNNYVGKTVSVKTEIRSSSGTVLGQNTKNVTLSSANGTVSNAVTIDASGLAGQTVVAYSFISYGGSTKASHTDASDTAQQVRFPSLGTSAAVRGTNSKVMPANGSVTIRDMVTYRNLVTGRSYTVNGTLMDRTTGTAVKVNGANVTGSATFTPSSASGTATVDFTFTAKDLDGRSFVVYEQLVTGGKVVGRHEVITDGGQTVYAPKIQTTATDTKTGDHVGMLSVSATVNDAVTLTNLVPGVTYTVRGTLMDKATGTAIGSSKEKTITAAAATESVYLDFTFTPTEGQTTVVFEKLFIGTTEAARHEDLTDEGQSVHYPKIRTTASDSVTRDHIGKAKAQTTLTDTVAYTNLVSGQSYTVKGTLYVKETGEKLMDAKGNAVTASKTFTPTSANGSVDLTFTFDASALEGKTVVAFEDLVHKNVTVAVHADINDADQSVRYPKIRTRARDSVTELTCANTAGNIVIIDEVTYENLIPGKAYTLNAILMDAASGTVINVNGTDVTGTVTFTPSSSNGTQKVQLSLNAAGLQGYDLVVFEDLVYAGSCVAEHKDLTDEQQTIRVPDIQTKAADEYGNKMIPDHGQVTVCDIVTYKNLVPGRNYDMRAAIMLRSTGEAAECDEHLIVAECRFTPEAPDGKVEVRAIVPVTDGFAGEALVVYEYLSYEGQRVAVHTVIDNEGQTVRIPVIGTTALSADTQEHISLAGENVTITDTVAYQNVTPGETFLLTGILMRRSTGEPVMDADGNPVTASKTVVSETEDGSVEMAFTFDASTLSGDTLVVFEEMYVEDVLVTAHQDIDDEGQSVHLPNGRTNASDAETGEQLMLPKENAVIKDILTYENLLPGKSYTVTGTLMNQATGEPLLIGGEAVTSSAEFTPETADGSVELTFELDASALAGTTVVAFEEVTHQGVRVFVHADIEDEAQTVRFPVLFTQAQDVKTKDHIALADKETALIDTVIYTNFWPDQEYVFMASLMDAETGEAIGVSQETAYTAESIDGSVDIEIPFDASAFAGRTIVIYEEAYLNATMVAEHKELTDGQQTIHLPEIGTTAKDGVTADHIALAEETMTLTDTVVYTNLIPGRTYTVTGTLMVKETGEALTDADGNPVTSGTELVPEEADGSVELTFTFDGRMLAGETLVAFETVTYNDVPVAVHEEIEDEDQSVHIPDGRTTATDAATGSHVGAVSEHTTIRDEVVYENLIPGRMYEITGTLMVKETGEALLDVDGSGITTTETFTPEAADGTYTLTFEVDSTLLENQTVVVFEEVSWEGFSVFIHADLNDEDQSVHYPEIKTSAKDQKTGDQQTLAEENAAIVDTVTYRNLVAGETYTVKGTLVNRKTGEPLLVDGKEVTAQTMFTVPEEGAEAGSRKDGTVEVVFTFDASALAGETLVVFENLVYQGVTVADHADLEDEDQTIHIAEIGTMARDGVTEDHIALAEEVMTLTDTVAYTNLIPGRTYIVKGTLMVKETGEALTDADGNPVTAETELVPEEADGSVELTFTFEGRMLAGETLVAFETVTYNDVPVAVHAEISDEDQSIHIPEGHTTATDETTKSHVGAVSECTSIRDEVVYENLIPGRMYEITGTLMVKETGETLTDADGAAIRITESFTPETADGTYTLTFEVDSTILENQTVVVFEEVAWEGFSVFIHADLDDEDQSVHYPEIKTSAKDQKTEDKLTLAEEKAAIVDTVTYRNLVACETYTVKGTLMNKETGEPLLVRGKAVTAQTTFTVPESEDAEAGARTDGTVEVVFIFDASALAGETLAVFEDLVYKDITVAVHADLEDEDQTIYIPKVRTTAEDLKTGSDMALAEEQMQVRDTVVYENLVPGKEYIVSGILMDKASGEPVRDDHGNEVTAETAFTPGKSDGSVELVFTFDGRLLAGKTLVAFETVTYMGREAAVHADLKDMDQTIYVPDIHTTAIDSLTLSHIGTVGEKSVITDIVTYHNLVPGRKYTLSGIMMDRDTGKPILYKGKEVKAMKIFTAKTADGSVELTFSFTPEEDQTVVACETVSYSGKKVAVHADLTDESQSVHYPKIRTHANDSQTKDHVGTAVKETIIMDTVTYMNLIPGKTYMVKGVLMDKKTKKPFMADGKEVAAELTFVPAQANGSVDLTFTFDGMLAAGKTLVVFEDLIHEGVEVTTHADLTDEDQTVYYPSVKTKARVNDKGSTMAAESITVKDMVSYVNLVPGKEYTVKGHLMDKETEEALMIGGKNVTAETIFTPEKPEGTVELTFTFNGMELGGKTLVVFESLYHEGIEVAVHADINDADQTVKIEKPPVPEVPKTGDTRFDEVLKMLLAVLAAAAGVIALLRYRRKRKDILT